MALFDLKICFCKSVLFETFLLCFTDVKSCSANMSHEGSLRVHIRAADMFHFENPSHACCGSGWKCVCLRGETRFVEVGPSSCAGHNQKRAHVMSCHVVSCHVMSWVWGHILTAAWPLRLEKGQGRPCVQQGGLTG